MKLLLLCNMIPGQVRLAMGLENRGEGVWLDHVLEGILSKDNINVFFLGRHSCECSGTVSTNFRYALFEEPLPERYYVGLEKAFQKILEDYSPDVIHIWGTEYGHTLAMINACERLNMVSKAVISLQGICAFCEQHHNEGIPQSVVHSSTFRDFIRQDNLAQLARKYTQRGVLEVEALKKAQNVIGRTEWDRATSMQINPALRYFHCNETMRPPFYSGVWTYENSIPHRIFAPGWRDPSKGFHNLLKAFPEILKSYPDAVITVPGPSYYPQSFKQRLRMRAYDKYLISLTDQFGLKDKIIFLGHLSAEQMKMAFLEANVFAFPSNVENSPNTVCESMLLGVPCVSSCVGGLLKMMKHGAEGFIYQPSAEYMLAYYIGEIFRMKADAQAMGAAARAHALQTHDPEQNLNTLFLIYREIQAESK